MSARRGVAAITVAEHRRVVYDQKAFLDRLRESHHPQPDYIASFQRGEQYRYPANRPGAPAAP